MDFTFLHAADLHLGSPFSGLSSRDQDLALRMSTASREAMEELVGKAIELRVNFLIIAGDLYDGDWKDTSIGHFFNRQMSRLDRAGIPVYLLRGNHDAESVITRAVTLPENVKLFSSRKVDSLPIPEFKVVLHGRSFADRAANENLAITYPQANPGWFNIGVLHTSLDGRPPHANYAPCTLADLIYRGYQYWALGHVHGYEELSRDPYIIYPGNLQGRGIRECGEKGAVHVQVEGGEVAAVNRLIVERIRWESLTADLSDCRAWTELFQVFESSIRAAVENLDDTPLIFRMTLVGATSLHRQLLADAGAVADEVIAAAARVDEQIWMESVKIATEETVALHAVGHVDPALAAVDLAAMLEPLMNASEVLDEARLALSEIQRKLPAMDFPESLFSDAGIQLLLLEARAALLTQSGK